MTPKGLWHFSCFLGLGNAVTIPNLQMGKQAPLRAAFQVPGLVVQRDPLRSILLSVGIWLGLLGKSCLVVLM